MAAQVGRNLLDPKRAGSHTCLVSTAQIAGVSTVPARGMPFYTRFTWARGVRRVNFKRAGAREGLRKTKCTTDDFMRTRSLKLRIRAKPARETPSKSVCFNKRACARERLCPSPLARARYRPKTGVTTAMSSLCEQARVKPPFGRLRAWCLNWTLCERARAMPLSVTCARRA